MKNQEEIEQLKKQLNDISDKIKQLEKPQFEVGKWYKHSSPEKEKILLYTTDLCNDGWFDCFGWNICGDWISSPARSYNDKGYTPATDKEVEEALIAEAKKRGFKEGVTADLSKANDVFLKSRLFKSNDFNYLTGSNGLSLDGVFIFYNGKWAEIVKEEKIMIGGKEVVFEYGQVFVDGLAYSKKDILNIKAVLDINKIQSLNVGCNGQYKVDLPLINKILDKLK